MWLLDRIYSHPAFQRSQNPEYLVMEQILCSKEKALVLRGMRSVGVSLFLGGFWARRSLKR